MVGGFGNWGTSDPPLGDQQQGNFYFNITTGQWNWFNNGSWQPIPGVAVVTPTGPTTSTSTTLGIQEALNSGRKVFVSAGAYNLPSSFAGIILGSNADIEFDMNAKVNVPNGYAGSLISVTPAATYARARGGTFNEQGTPQNLWDFISLKSVMSSGIEFCWFEDMFCFNPNRGIVIQVGGGGTYVNANTFRSLRIDAPNVGIDFVQAGGQVQGNSFMEIPIEAGNLARFTDGVRNVYGDRNLFLHVFVYDALGGANLLTIASGATRTQVLGGNLTTQNFTDSGTNSNLADGLNVLFNGNGDIIWSLPGSVTQPNAALATIHNDNNKNLFLNGNASVNIRANGSTKLAATTSGINVVTRINAMNGATTSLTTGSIFQGLQKAGIPSDSDFTNPVDGLEVIDTADLRKYYRIGGAWHYTALT